MDKFYLLQSSSPFPKEGVFHTLSETGIDIRTINFLSPTKAIFKAPASYYPELRTLFAYFKAYVSSAQVSVLICHAHTEFEDRLSDLALAYFPNAASFPNEIIMKEVSYDNYASYSSLMALFRPVSHDEDLFAAAKVYLACGMDACLASKALGVHRNTFNYRLNSILEKTGVDLRDYHNALLFEIYLQFKGKR